MRTVPGIATLELRRLREDGIEPTDDEVVWLASLGQRVESPKGQTKEASGFTGACRMSDGTVLRPLTLRADAWLAEYGSAMVGSLDILAVGYAASHLYSLEFDIPAREAVKAVKTWGKRLNVAPEELRSAIEKVIGVDDAPDKPESDEDEEDKPLDSEALIGTMVAGTGLPREYWENESWVAVEHAHSGLMKYAAMVSGGEYDPDKATGQKALADLSRAVIEIRKSRESA